MNAPIVYAKPEPTSLCGALKDAGARTLHHAGYGVESADLSGENFNPVGGRHGFTSVADAERAAQPALARA
jgi:NAD(P)H dehydrogenase (quinone)